MLVERLKELLAKLPDEMEIRVSGSMDDQGIRSIERISVLSDETDDGNYYEYLLIRLSPSG